MPLTGGSQPIPATPIAFANRTQLEIFDDFIWTEGNPFPDESSGFNSTAADIANFGDSSRVGMLVCRTTTSGNGGDVYNATVTPQCFVTANYSAAWYLSGWDAASNLSYMLQCSEGSNPNSFNNSIGFGVRTATAPGAPGFTNDRLMAWVRRITDLTTEFIDCGPITNFVGAWIVSAFTYTRASHSVEFFLNGVSVGVIGSTLTVPHDVAQSAFHHNQSGTSAAGFTRNYDWYRFIGTMAR